MGTFTETLRLFVDADMKGAISQTEKFGQTVKREGDKAEKSLDKWGSRLQTAGVGMVAFGSAALFGLGKMAMASEEAHLAVVKLENTVSNMPKLAGENTKQFIDLADSIQDVTAADADAIVEGQALLGTFNLTADQIKGITPLVVDYARKFGTDIPAASIQVGKALDGSIGALKKNGVSIDEALYKTDRYRAVQEALSDQVGGFAEAEGKTFAGSLQRLKNELGDLSEGVGAGAVEAFTTMFGAVSKASDALNSISPGLQGTIGKIATFGAVGLIAAGGVSTLIGTAIKAKENFQALGEGVSALSGKMGGLKGAGGIAGVVAIAAGLAVVLGEANAASNRIAVDLDKLAAALNDTSEAGRESLEQGIEQAMAFDKLDDVVKKVADENFVLAEQLVDTAESMGLEADEAEKLRDAIAKKKSEDVQGAVAQEEHSAAVEEGAEAMRDQAEATGEAKTALQEYADAQKALFDPLFAFNDALLANEEAQQKVTQAELAVIAADKELTKAQRENGRSSDEATEAAINLMEANEDLEEAHRNVIESAVDYDSAFAELKTAVQNGTITIGEAKTAIDRWADSGRLGASSAAFYKGEVDKLAGALKQQPGRVATKIEVTNAVQARETIYSVRDALNAIPRLTRAQIEVAVTQKGGIAVPGGGRIFHGGGIVQGPPGADVPATLKVGEGVFTETQMAALGFMARGHNTAAVGGESTVRLIWEVPPGTDRRFLEWIRHMVRVEGGGDVQRALGQ